MKRKTKGSMGLCVAALLWLAASPAVMAQTVYVSQSGTNDVAGNYDTWEGAATNIHDAMACAHTLGRNVTVGSGAYALTNTIVITTNIAVQGLNGPAATTLYRNGAYGSFSVMTVSNAGAFVAGITVSNGNSGTASGIAIYGGTVSNVTVKNCDSLKAVYIQNALLTGSVVSNNLRDALYVGANGTVQDCVIARNRADLNGYASPVAIIGGGALMNRCRILNNYSIAGWGRYANAYGVYLVNGTLRNTLLAGNINNDQGNNPGGVRVAGGTMENCTITANTNTSDSTVGKGVHQTGGTIRNCVISGNAGSLTASDYTSSGGAIVYSLAPSLPAGTASSNLNINPLLTGASFQLAVASPCRDAGTNIAAVVSDLGGNPRPLSGGTRGGLRYDMGAWEMDGTSGAFDVGFHADAPLNGLDSLTVTFRPNATGSDTNVVWFGWDFNNDGAYDATGSGMPVVSNTFGPGLYTIVLRATNGLGEVASFTNANYVSVVGGNLYVAANGSHQFPYDTWAKASTNVNAAVDAAVGGCMVSISNGAFLTSKQIVLSSGIRMRGAGRGSTILQYGAGNGILKLGHADARASDLTVRGGSGGVASGIDITAGAASNVAVVSCGSPRSVSVAGGTLLDSLITNNTYGVSVGANGIMENCVVSNNAQYAWGDYVPVVVNGSGAMVNRCRVVGNYAPSGAGRYNYAFGVRVAAGTLRNTLVARNINLDYGNTPGGVLISGGVMENCTIAGNTNGVASTQGKGVHQTGGTIRNCVIFGNGGSLTASDYTTGGGSMQHSLAPSLATGLPNNNLNGDPDFSDASFRVGVASPCVNAGTNQVWMESAMDLVGAVRRLAGVVDMGAYELDPSTLSFSIGFYGDAPLSGLDSLPVVFRAGASGPVSWYGWDFNNDGTCELSGAGLGTVTNTFGPGLYTVVLMASNNLGMAASATNANYVSVVGGDLYAATNGSHQFPYDTWAKAASNVNAAVDAAVAGCTVHVGAGTFRTSAQLDLSKAVRMEGGGRDTTILLYGAGTGVLRLGHTNAFVTALTVKGGAGGLASGIHITGGTASNVAVTACGAPYSVSIENGLMTAALLTSNSYGVFVGSNGTMEASVVAGNAQYANGGYAPVLLGHGSALVNRCRVVGNYSPGGAGRYLSAMGVRVAAGTLRNTLVAGNHNDDVWSYNTDAGGVMINGGSMENCTIMANTNTITSGYGKGVHQSGGTIRNCVIHGNGGSPAAGDYASSGGSIRHSLAPELSGGDPNNNLNGDPLFRDSEGRLGPASPCVNTGTNLPALLGTMDLDGMRRIRLVVDMGAYESELRGSAFRLR